MVQAAHLSFQTKSPRQNRDYLSGQTWQLIQQRQSMRDQRDVRAELRLNWEIKKSARRDKLSWKRSNLEDLTDTRKAWKTIRFEKQTFSPKYFAMKDIRGNRVPLSKKADAIAEYLF